MIVTLVSGAWPLVIALDHDDHIFIRYTDYKSSRIRSMQELMLPEAWVRLPFIPVLTSSVKMISASGCSDWNIHINVLTTSNDIYQMDINMHTWHTPEWSPQWIRIPTYE